MGERAKPGTHQAADTLVFVVPYLTDHLRQLCLRLRYIPLRRPFDQFGGLKELVLGFLSSAYELITFVYVII